MSRAKIGLYHVGYHSARVQIDLLKKVHRYTDDN